MANLVIESIVKSYIKGLTLEELSKLINESLGEKSPFIYGDKRPDGDIRTVELPNINATSEFDELMDSFKAVHCLTKIS